MAEQPQFVHLHNHSEYSLLDGGQKLDVLVRRAKELGMPAVAITDHGNLFGAIELIQLGKKEGLKPIVGCEVYLAAGSRLDRIPSQTVHGKAYYHLVLLAENNQGFRNLVKLVSYGYTEGFYYRPRIDKQLLRAHHEGLIALTACLSGEIPVRLQRGDLDGARAVLAEYLEIFGQQNVYLEIQDQGIPQEELVNQGMLTLSRETGVPLVATNDCHFTYADDHKAHDILICIGTGKKREDGDRMRYSPDHYFKSYQEMAQRFADLPQALASTLEIAARCELDLDHSQHHVPAFPVDQGETLESTFRHRVRRGFDDRRQRWEQLAISGVLRHSLDEYEERLETELETIVKMGFSGYFLVVWDFIRYAREAGIPVGPGRGSAAGSLVAYCLRITDIDPLEYDLLFERFLNPERITMPDIDIDFCFRRRGEVIDYVTRKYGRENVAQIITFGTMAAKAAIRDTGRVLGLPYADVDRIAKLVPDEIGVQLADAIEAVPQLKQLVGQGTVESELLDVALRLEGLSRHASTHAAGVVITPQPVVEFAPLFRSNKDEITTQWAMGDIESIGLLKMDFLGLKTLTLIADALDLIERSSGVKVDLDSISLNDPKTLELFGRGDTSGVFQFESSGMRDILRRLKPEKFEDLIALNALYRPGPLGSGMIDDFIQRRHGKVKVSYPHPSLEPVLRETYGVIVYQEQVMQIASLMAGYSLGGADLLRRAMGKKKKEVMEAEREKFIAGASQNSIAAADATRVFDLMEHFAGYGFNKSHSAAYALVAFHTAYLKAHYPVYFMAALLTTEKDNTDKLVEYVAECRERGIRILPPDVERSEVNFSVEGDAIRFGMSAVKGVGVGTVDAIIEARRRCDGLKTLDSLCREVDRKFLNRRAVEALIKAGALDAMGARERLVAGLESALERASRAAGDRASGQVSLFGDDSAAPARLEPELPPAAAWSARERLAYERESLGFYLSGHPLDAVRDRLAETTTHAVAELMATQGEVWVGGVISALKRRRTRQGEMMAVFALEDATGSAECVLFPKLYKELGEGLAEDQTVVIHGRAESAEGSPRILVEGVSDLATARVLSAGAVTILLDGRLLGAEMLGELSRILDQHRGPTPVYFEVVRAGEYRVILQADDKSGVRADREFFQQLHNRMGVACGRYGRPGVSGVERERPAS
jgi:DNA polymerase-3 subunit alpha